MNAMATWPWPSAPTARPWRASRKTSSRCATSSRYWLRLGKTEEAKAIAQRVARIEPVPPFQYFNKGVAAYQHGPVQQARDLFAREVKRAPYYDEFHFWLAASLLQLGELEQAREQLALAADTSTQKDTRKLYNAKLAHLRQLGMR
jgi:tetratricopeptide (TPR) repeat protein